MRPPLGYVCRLSPPMRAYSKNGVIYPSFLRSVFGGRSTAGPRHGSPGSRSISHFVQLKGQPKRRNASLAGVRGGCQTGTPCLIPSRGDSARTGHVSVCDPLEPCIRESNQQDVRDRAILVRGRATGRTGLAPCGADIGLPSHGSSLPRTASITEPIGPASIWTRSMSSEYRCGGWRNSL